jgi:hypothetical protein
MSVQNTICHSFYEIHTQYSIGFYGLSSAMSAAVFTHQIGIVYIVKSFRVFEVQIFPLENSDQGKEYNGICPERMNEYKRGQSHAIAPVIYPARAAALVVHEPLKGAKNNNTELVHKDEKKDNHIEPHIRKDSHKTPHPHNEEQKNPVQS